MELEVQDSGPAGRIAAEPVRVVDPLNRWASQDSERAILSAYRNELIEYRGRLRKFPGLEPDEVMLEISGIHARLGEIRADLVDAGKTRADQLRTKQVDPLREDLEFQFKLHSRRLAMMEAEIAMTRGMT